MAERTPAGTRVPGRTIAIALLLMLLPASPWAAEMTETVLPNGLRVVMRQVEGNPVVCSAVLVRAGVAWEPENMSGVSHFLEHLLFNGSEKRSQEQLYADVDSIGAYNNATTRADHTLFLLLAPSEHLEKALEIQADMLLHSTLPEDKFRKEKGIVLEEMGRDAGDPAHLAGLFFTRHLYAGSPYARPVLGTMSSIQALTRKDVSTYYHDRYTPRRMVLFLAGEFDPAEALKFIRQQFTSGAEDSAPVEPDDSLPQATLAFEELPQASHQFLEAGRTYLRAAFPAPPAGDPDGPAFRLMTQALGSRSSALHQALKGGEHPAVYDYSLAYVTTGGTGSLTLSASLTEALPPAQVMKIAAVALWESVAPGALKRTDLQMLHEEQLTSAATLAEQVHYYAMFRAPRLLVATSAQLAREDAAGQDVDVARLGLLAQRYMDPLRAVVTISGPGETEGETSSIDLSTIQKIAPTGAAVIETDATSSATHVLENGLTLSIRTSPDAEVFAIHLLARNRSALEPLAQPGLADLVHRLLLRGTMASSAKNLEEKLRGLGMNTKFHDDPRFPFDDYRTTPLYSFAIMEARTKNTVEAMRLFAEILQTPRFDPSDIRHTVEVMKDLTRRQAESSRTVSARIFFDLVGLDTPLARPVSGSSQSLAGVTRQDVLSMYRKLMQPNNLILTLRGSGDSADLLERARDLFGGSGPGGGFSLAAASGDESAEPTTLQVLPPSQGGSQRQEETLGKRQSYLRLGTILQVPAEDRPALAVATLVLSNRLQMNLRERQGLAYSVGANLTLQGGRSHLLLISMGTAPENLARGEAELRRIAKELGTAPVTEEEVRRLVAARTGRILMRRLPSQNQAMYDGLQILYGMPTGGNLEFLAAMGMVTPAQVTAAARHYIHPHDWSLAVVR